MPKNVLSFSEFLNEKELPSWSKPKSNVFNFEGKSGKGLEKYQNAKSRMSGNFTPGDTVKVKSDDKKLNGMKGKIISMEGLKITVRFEDRKDLEKRGWDMPFDYEFKPENVTKIK